MMNVNDVYTYNKELQRIANYYTSDPDIAADAVQTLYLKLCEIQQKEGNLDRIFYNGKLNMVYIFTSIRNIIISDFRKTKNIEPLPERYDCLGEPDEDEITTSEMTAIIKRELSQMREYDRLLCLIYYTENHSIRSMAAAVGISAKNIHYTLQRVQNRIKDVILRNQDKFPKYEQRKKKTS